MGLHPHSHFYCAEYAKCGIGGTLVIGSTCFTYVPPIFIRNNELNLCVNKEGKNAEYAAKNILLKSI